jgi:shikimate kinase
LSDLKRIHLHLIGFMGSGKTEVGRVLARRLNLPFVDADAAIERKAGMPVAEIFRRKGEKRFRALESELASKLTGSVSRVFAWGGGAWLSAENRKNLLESGTVILLTCSEAELWKRLEPEIPVRPLLSGPDPRAKFKALLKARKNAYRGADMQVPTTRKTPEEIAGAILKRLRGR